MATPVEIEIRLLRQQFRREMQAVRQQLTGLNSSLGAVTSTFRTLGGVIGTLGLGKLALDVVKASTAIQDMQARMSALTGSSEAGAAELAYVSETAQQLGISLDTAREGYAKLLSLQRSGLTTQEETRELFEGLAKASAVAGLSSSQVGNVIFGLSQALSQARVQADELNQVVEPLPGFLAELDKAAGLASGGFRRLVTDTGITGETLKRVFLDALPSYTQGAEALADNTSRNFTRLRNEYQLLQESLAKPINTTLSPLLAELRRQVDGFQPALDRLKTTFDSGIIPATARAEAELWAQSLRDGVQSVGLEVEGLKFAFNESLAFIEIYAGNLGDTLKSALLDFPANVKVLFTAIIGEADVAASQVSAAWNTVRDNVSAAMGNAAAAIKASFANAKAAVLLFFEDIRAGIAKPLDGLRNELASVFGGVQSAFEFAGFDDAAKQMAEVAQSLRNTATSGKESEERVRRINAELTEELQLAKNLEQPYVSIADAIRQATYEAERRKDAGVAAAVEERNAVIAARDARIQELQTQRQQIAAQQAVKTAAEEEARAKERAAQAGTKTASQQLIGAQKEIALRSKLSAVVRDTAAQVNEIRRRGLSESKQQISLEREANAALARSYLALAKAQQAKAAATKKAALEEAEGYRQLGLSLAGRITNERSAISITESAGRRRKQILEEEQKSLEESKKAAKDPIKPLIDKKAFTATDNALDGLIKKLEKLGQGVTIKVKTEFSGGGGDGFYELQELEKANLGL